jgi:hypothetical protein
LGSKCSESRSANSRSVDQCRWSARPSRGAGRRIGSGDLTETCTESAATGDKGDAAVHEERLGSKCSESRSANSRSVDQCRWICDPARDATLGTPPAQTRPFPSRCLAPARSHSAGRPRLSSRPKVHEERLGSKCSESRSANSRSVDQCRWICDPARVYVCTRSGRLRHRLAPSRRAAWRRRGHIPRDDPG